MCIFYNLVQPNCHNISYENYCHLGYIYGVVLITFLQWLMVSSTNLLKFLVHNYCNFRVFRQFNISAKHLLTTWSCAVVWQDEENTVNFILIDQFMNDLGGVILPSGERLLLRISFHTFVHIWSFCNKDFAVICKW